MINVLTGLIGLRFLLILFGADPSQPLAAFFIPFTDPLVALFDGIVVLPADQEWMDQEWMQRFDVAALFAIAGLQLVALLLRAAERLVHEIP